MANQTNQQRGGSAEEKGMKKESVKFAVLMENKTLAQSLLSTFTTLVSTAFLIYISSGSTWWTFVTGALFLLVLFGKVAEMTKNNRVALYSKKEAIDWAQGLPDDK
jgi:predicted transcriptional regulator